MTGNRRRIHGTNVWRNGLAGASLAELLEVGQSVVRGFDAAGRCVLLCALALCGFASLGTAHAKGVQIVYAFKGRRDGGYPQGGLIRDEEGNLYGTGNAYGRGNNGVVFKLTPDGNETVLYAFTGGEDGGGPTDSLLMDKVGNLYGTTSDGGHYGEGNVFKLSPDGTETSLHSFGGEGDGFYPYGGLIADKRGNLFGTTMSGGANGIYGFGTVFKVAPNGKETVLYSFKGGSDGSDPFATLIADAAGNFYGTTSGGDCCNDYGTVFKLSPDGTETVLYAFTGGTDGRYPQAGLMADGEGNLYGTTEEGGSIGCGGYRWGTVFKLTPAGSESVLYDFKGCHDGGSPGASLVEDLAGNFYGTTVEGGSSSNCDGFGCGTVFKIAPDGTEKILYSFKGGSDGSYPFAGVIARRGELFGAATGDLANGTGAIFKVRE